MFCFRNNRKWSQELLWVRSIIWWQWKESLQFRRETKPPICSSWKFQTTFCRLHQISMVRICLPLELGRECDFEEEYKHVWRINYYNDDTSQDATYKSRRFQLLVICRICLLPHGYVCPSHLQDHIQNSPREVESCERNNAHDGNAIDGVLGIMVHWLYLQEHTHYNNILEYTLQRRIPVFKRYAVMDFDVLLWLVNIRASTPGIDLFHKSSLCRYRDINFVLWAFNAKHACKLKWFNKRRGNFCWNSLTICFNDLDNTHDSPFWNRRSWSPLWKLAHECLTSGSKDWYKPYNHVLFLFPNHRTVSGLSDKFDIWSSKTCLLLF